jgi:hypothetical protein
MEYKNNLVFGNYFIKASASYKNINTVSAKTR